MDKYRFTTKKTELIINKEAVTVLHRYQQTTLFKKEGCGVLLGSLYADGCYSIEMATTPMRKDHRSRNTFKLLDSGHQLFVDKFHEESDGELFYLGYWHSHPEKVPSPSNIDRVEWKKNHRKNINHSETLFYPIIGTNQLCVWTIENNKLIKMDNVK